MVLWCWPCIWASGPGAPWRCGRRGTTAASSAQWSVWTGRRAPGGGTGVIQVQKQGSQRLRQIWEIPWVFQLVWTIEFTKCLVRGTNPCYGAPAWERLVGGGGGCVGLMAATIAATNLYSDTQQVTIFFLVIQKFSSFHKQIVTDFLHLRYNEKGSSKIVLWICSTASHWISPWRQHLPACLPCSVPSKLAATMCIQPMHFVVVHRLLWFTSSSYKRMARVQLEETTSYNVQHIWYSYKMW